MSVPCCLTTPHVYYSHTNLYAFLHTNTHSFSYKYVHTHSISYKYVHTHSFAYKYVHTHSFSCKHTNKHNNSSYVSLHDYSHRDKQGHLVTNYHVVRDASDLQVTLQGGKEYNAKVIGFDADKDIAVLKINSDAEVCGFLCCVFLCLCE